MDGEFPEDEVRQAAGVQAMEIMDAMLDPDVQQAMMHFAEAVDEIITALGAQGVTAPSAASWVTAIVVGEIIRG